MSSTKKNAQKQIQSKIKKRALGDRDISDERYSENGGANIVPKNGNPDLSICTKDR